MSEPNDAARTDEGPWIDPPDEGYSIKEEASPPPPPTPPAEEIEGARPWFATDDNGQRQGPMSTPQLRAAIASGRLSRGSYVWREGMRSWTPARELPELVEPRPDLDEMPAPPRIPFVKDDYWWAFHQLTRIFSQPFFFRLVGRASGALALVVQVSSLLLWFWGWTWFSGALGLAMLFFLGEATAAVLDRLDRIDAHLAPPEQKLK